MFVASPSVSDIAVIDSATDAVASRIRLSAPPGPIVALDRGAKLLVANTDERRLTVFDTVTGAVAADHPTTVAPVLLQVSPVGQTLAVADPRAGSVELVRPGAAPTIIDGLPDLRSMAFEAKGLLLVAHGSSVALIDGATGRRGPKLAVAAADGPIAHVAATPGGDLAVVLQAERGVLSLFDLRTQDKVSRLVLPTPLGRPFPSPDSQFILLPVDGGRALSVVSTWTYRESRRLPLKAPVSGFGLGVLQSVFVGLSVTSRSMQTIDLQDRRNLAVLALPGAPKAGAPSSSGAKFYVALDDGGRIAVVDLLQPSVARIIETAIDGATAVVPALDGGFCH
ncbi:DNA-binding beta-propeller fold protein YncE [Azospirillum agricola]|uniref:hypothetical protein n=1 Tax=Azospirillum agricola TaxID=1720247 RepID=UPI001AEB2D42|nr:hypothetical protein [Azospirillum agricola]MBP2232608.1 DNA-binding beta-propeller fold protein YncE [Azospirillum agricola]